MRGARGLLTVGLVASFACLPQVSPYEHNRYDYGAFRARVGRLPEPNYLPWLLHRETVPAGGEALVACRWPDEAFPLRVHVSRPAIPKELQDEFNPRDPQEYVAAVGRAFTRWEREIGRPLRFVTVDSPAQADVRVHLQAEGPQEGPGRILGRVRNEAGRCQVMGEGTDLEHVEIRFSVPETYLYVTDTFGLITPRQLETVALHEIGHVLGASGQHSPLQGDVMFKIANDRRVEKISEHDRNSFQALYRLDPGAVYARLGEQHARPLQEVRRGPPKLGTELVSEKFRFALRFPMDWQVIRSPRGWVAVDGLSWDYDASIQVIALRGDLDAYMHHRARQPRAPGEFVSFKRHELDGQPVGRVVVQDEEFTEEATVLDWNPGWILVVVAECRSLDYPLYQTWVQRVLWSLRPYEQADEPAVLEPPS